MNRARLVLAIIICGSYLHSMELPLASLTYTYGTTKINLTKGDIYDFDGKADVIVLGEQERSIPIEKSCFGADSKSIIISGKEPKIFLMHDIQKNESIYCYHRFHYLTPDENIRLHEFYKGEEAIKHAGEDLYDFYQDALSGGYSRGKSIAIPTLSTSAGFPRNKAAVFAVSAIIDRIKTFPKEYDFYNMIYLVVNKESDFDLYKKLLEGHIAEQK